MIETLRRLGFASRFVSGYLYDSALDGGEVGATGSGATHAWVEVFLRGPDGGSMTRPIALVPART
jgi:transglutaminase-like putative cysteine protease